MNVTFEKIDPSCFNILPIRFSEDPVQSLSTIGINFSALDAEICNLGFSATNLWNPLYTEFVDNSGNWDSVYNTVHDFSACWQSTFTTVRDLSAAWLSPITIIYPSIFNPGDFDQSVITSWVQTNFPVSQGNCINYLNGQRMKVFSLEYKVSKQDITARCNANGGVSIIKWIGIGQILSTCGCNCSPVTVSSSDRYVNQIRGIEYIVTNGVWVYLQDIY